MFSATLKLSVLSVTFCQVILLVFEAPEFAFVYSILFMYLCCGCGDIHPLNF